MESNITQRNEAMSKFDANVQCEETYRFEIVHTSGCCGAYLTDGEAEHELCPECRDHCEVICETVPVAYC